MKQRTYTYDFGTHIKEVCPYGMHYKNSKTIFKIGSGACKECCPYSILSKTRPHPANTVLCTADEAEKVFKTIDT